MERVEEIAAETAETIVPSPKEDFFRHVNSRWLEENPIPPSESRWGTFNVLRDTTLMQLRIICEQLQTESSAIQGSNTQIVRDFYYSGMNIESRNKQGIESIRDLLVAIDNIKTSNELAKILATLHMSGIGPFFGPYVYKDIKDPDTNALYFTQAGLGMPDRDYYLEDNENMQKVRGQYQDYVTSVFKLAGYDKEKAEEASGVVWGIEGVIAEASLPKEAVREVDKNYHKFTPKEAKKMFPSLDWDEYLKNLSAKDLESFVIEQPTFLSKIDKLLKSADTSDIKMYLKWTLLNRISHSLSEDFVMQRFNFYGKVLQGVEEPKPTWKLVMERMQGKILTEALGPLYIERHFSPEAKNMILEMVENIKMSFRKRVEVLGWMSDKTKKITLEKLDKITFKMGYPDKWLDISPLNIEKESYAKNLLHLQEFHSKRKMKQVGQPVDWSEWIMAPIEVNACADQMREMTFPAAILQPPFFDPDADAAYNYGAIGSVIGHELTHFFDDQGCKFDSEGKLNEWWSDQDKSGFEKGSKKFIEHYGKYSIEGVPVNAEFTLGENIADVGGLMIAFDAYKKYLEESGEYTLIDGLTPEQRFFVGYARTECANLRLEERRRRYKTDSHSPSEVRVNAVLSITPQFIKAFGVSEGDGMYVPPENIPTLW